MSQEEEAKENRGGQRPGAGRKPKALRWAEEIAQAEGQIIKALPKVIEGLIKAASEGDFTAARYLMDRIWGRVPEQATPLAEDISLPTDHEVAGIFARHKAAHQFTQEIQDSNPKMYQEMREALDAATSVEAWKAYSNKKNSEQPERDNLAKMRAELEKEKAMVGKLLVALQEDIEEEQNANAQEIKEAAE